MVKALLRNKRFSIHGAGTTLQIQVPVFSCEPFTESENDVSYDFDLIKPLCRHSCLGITLSACQG